MDCSFTVNNNLNTIFQCVISNAGIPFDFIAIGIMLIFVVFAMVARLDFDISLAFAIILTWALTVISGGSTVLMYIMALLIIGFGLRIFMSILSIFGSR